MRKTIATAILCASLNFGCGERLFQEPKPSHTAVLMDNSLSITPECGAIVGAVRRITHQPAFGDGSSVTLLMIGVAPNRPQALRIFDKKLPVQPDAVFGRDDADFEKTRVAFFSEMELACQSAPPSGSSPILRMLQDGMEHLHARGCGPNLTCSAEVQSDMREDANEALRSAIAKTIRDQKADAPASLVGSIENAGIDVHICGGEARAIAPDWQASPESLRRIWLQLFSQPQRVTFKPFCGE